MIEIAAWIIIGAVLMNASDRRNRKRRARELEARMPPHWSKSWPWNR